MDWELAGVFAEVVGAIAIFVSLIYVAVQIKRSNQIAKAEAERDLLQSWMRGLEGLVDSNQTTEIFLKGLADFDALSSIEKTRLSYRLTELNMVYIAAIENEKKAWSIGRWWTPLETCFFPTSIRPADANGGRRLASSIRIRSK